MDIDFRRCRDRANLLLHQYRDKDFDVLRKSGTPDEYKQKEQLLKELSDHLEAEVAATESPGGGVNVSGAAREKKRMRIVSPLNAGSIGRSGSDKAAGNGTVQRTQGNEIENGSGSGGSIDMEIGGVNSLIMPYLYRVEQKAAEYVELGKRRLDLERKKMEWDVERENKRLMLERERMAKEFEDRKAERDARFKQWEAEHQERSRMMNLIFDIQQRKTDVLKDGAP